MPLSSNSSADKRQIEILRLDKTREASILVRELLAERLRVISEAGTATEANLFTSIGRRCLTTHKSIWEIAKPKYIAEMNILLRPLAEAVITACYLQIAHPSEAANYLHFDKIAIYKQAEKFNALCCDPMTEAMKKTHIGMKDDADQAQALIGRNAKKLSWSDVSVFNRARAIDDWLIKSKLDSEAFVAFSRSVYDAAHPYTHYTASTLRHNDPLSPTDLWQMRLTLVAAYICLKNLNFFACIFFRLPSDNRDAIASDLISSIMDSH